jgi:hypothetical protein
MATSAIVVRARIRWQPACAKHIGVNGRRLTLTNDEAYDLIIDVAAGKLDSVDGIAAILAAATAPRP